MARTFVEVRNPAPAQAVLWRIGQVLGVLGTVGLIVGLVTIPETALRILWDVSIPILPAVFLVSPHIWRNVCPLATVNKLTGDRFGRRTLPPGWMAGTTLLGVVLLYALVPARRFLFNTNGIALAVVIAAVVVLAALLGVVFQGKAGFCNAVCPVLNVERLYGQRPLTEVANARCGPCTLCSARGCMDLSPQKSVAQTVGPKRRTRAWVTTPFGAFAATFPGFVVAYFTTGDGPLSSAPVVYGTFALWCAASFAAVALVSALRPERNQQMVLFLAGLSIGLYYWFAAPSFLGTLGAPAGFDLPFRVIAIVAVTLWLHRSLRAA